MERRDFLCSAAAVAAGTLVAPPVVKADNQAAQKKYGVKITVVKRDFDKAMNEKYKTGNRGPCDQLAVNHEFIAKMPWVPPEKFCEWAWADIRTYIHMVNISGNPMLTCCTDGNRPVTFRLERVEL